MSILIPSNDRLKAKLEADRTFINAGLGFHLFIADVVPGPGRLLDEYTEAFFPGYVPLPTVGLAGAPVKITDGLYEIAVGPFVTLPTADSSQIVYGWVLTNGPLWYWAGRFNVPVTVTDGVSIDVTIRLQEGSLSLCPGYLG